MSETTPWWERGAPRASRDGDGDDACSFSTSETVTCKTEPDENGVPRRKCERIVTKFRLCPGREPEELERTRTETNEEPPPGIFGAGSAFASSERRVETSSWRGGDPSAPPFPFPTVPAFDGRFPFPFGAFGDASPEAPTSSFGSHFFGSLAAMLSGLSDVAREMERLERGRTTEGATDPDGARTLAERNRGNDAPAPEKPEKASEDSER